MEEAKDEDEIVAKSGESGQYGNDEDSDPWSTGEIKQLRTKWLQQELEEEATNNKEIESWSSKKSLSCRRLSTSARLSHSRSCHSSYVHNVENEDIDTELGSSKREPTRFPLETSKQELKMQKCTCFLEYVDILAHLAFFGILGVLIRYGSEVLFDDVLSVTHESSIVYRDLPANMVGSFFMGWVGIVFKEHIRVFSEPLALGLSTGLMGSITTYAGWNQKMVVLLTSGNVAASLAGLLLGMCAAIISLLAGIDSAKASQLIIARSHPEKLILAQEISNKKMSVSFHHGILRSMVVAFAAFCLWGAALSLLVGGRSSQKLRILWFACLVAPVGVWMRWHLARFNGKGVCGKVKWLPLGTLLANLIGATLAAILALLQFVKTNDTAVLLLGGLQLGFIGCLSTVSTFVAEVYTMYVGRKKSKAYMYTFLTLILGLFLCIFIYSIPSWTLDYVKW
ncbi:hypothetical protein GOP47_0021506 [Adiantum capillus-veneris]|uniref:Uncharacterized protein n=1 Tax=Adiantum capillus-veneris TaxID=13818 RepID=A0A9D4U7J2_ADICA|nr:hypothetical protein GOP47_0021506 [Adiantum capillus-veneris]